MKTDTILPRKKRLPALGLILTALLPTACGGGGGGESRPNELWLGDNAGPALRILQMEYDGDRLTTGETNSLSLVSTTGERHEVTLYTGVDGLQQALGHQVGMNVDFSQRFASAAGS